MLADNISYIYFQILEFQGAHSSKVNSDRKFWEVRPTTLYPTLSWEFLVLNSTNSSERGWLEGRIWKLCSISVFKVVTYQKICVGIAWEEDIWYKFKYFLCKLLIVFWIIVEHFHQERWIVKFQVTQATASLIINKWFQLLPLLGDWFYRSVSITIHPWLLSFLFLEKPLDLTLLGRALASIGKSPLILVLWNPILCFCKYPEQKGSFPSLSSIEIPPELYQITNAKPSQLLATPGKVPSSVGEILSMFHSVSTESLVLYWFLKNGVRSRGTTILL